MDILNIGDIRNFDGYGVGVVCEVGYLKYLMINEMGNENYIKTTSLNAQLKVGFIF